MQKVDNNLSHSIEQKTVSPNIATKKITLYHGGDKEMKVADIMFPGPRKTCDFGPAFYLSPDKSIAEEWVRKKVKCFMMLYQGMKRVVLI